MTVSKRVNAEYVMRSIAVMACATTMSLFTTIAAYATVNVVAAKYDGPACRTSACAPALANQTHSPAKPAKHERVAAAPARAL